MKHTIQVNNKNRPEHIIHLDQHLPITIQPLPRHIAYKIQNTPIITTTTRTLQTETIKENPQITIHNTTPQKLTQTLQELLTNMTPQKEQPITTRGYTLYHDKTPIKTYTNQEYLQLIQKTLTTNPQLTLQQAEYQAQKEYYKYISYDKTNHLYKLTLNKKTTSTHTKLTHAIQEKQTRTNNTEPEEETLCQKQDTQLEPLPPTPWNNTQHHITREHNKYQTTKKTTHNNPDTITYLEKTRTTRTTILNTQKPDRNITHTKNTYTILKKQDKKLNKYYRTHDKTQARYIRDKLEQHQYDKTIIPTYEQQYKKEKKQYQKTYNKKYQTIDYYQTITINIYPNNTIKEKYQQQRIQTS